MEMSNVARHKQLLRMMGAHVNKVNEDEMRKLRRKKQIIKTKQAMRIKKRWKKSF